MGLYAAEMLAVQEHGVVEDRGACCMPGVLENPTMQIKILPRLMNGSFANDLDPLRRSMRFYIYKTKFQNTTPAG